MIRSAGSKSPVDLIAWRVDEKDGEEEVHLIQCKKARKKVNYAKDIKALRAVSAPEYWWKLLYVKRDRKVQMTFVSDNDLRALGALSVKDIREELA